MCGGGSNQVTTTTNQKPPRYLQESQKQAVGMAQQAASAPFAQPVAPIAPFTPFQQQAHQQIAAMQGMTDPYYEAAKAQLGAAGTEITQDDIERYLNPYRNEVLANMQKYIFGPQRVQTMGSARQRAGGPSADRLALTSQNLDFTQADALSQALAGFYNPALAQAQRSKEMALQTGLGWGNLGTSAQNAALQATGALGTAGAQQQALDQAQQTAEHNQQMAELAYPFQTAAYLSGINAQTAPGAGGTSTGTTTYPTPSPLNQIVGLGTSALGAYMGMPGGGTGKGSGVPNYGQSYNIGYGGQMMPVFGMPSNRGGRIGYAHGGRAGYAKGGGAGDFTSGMTGQGNPFPTMPTNPTAMPQGVANLSSVANPAIQPNLPSPQGQFNPDQPRPIMQAMQDWREQGRPRGFWRDWFSQHRDQFPAMPNAGGWPGGQLPSQAQPTLPMIPPGTTPPIYAGSNPYQAQLGQIASGFAEGGGIRNPQELLNVGMKLAQEAMGGSVNPYDIGQGFDNGGEVDDFSSRFAALPPPGPMPSMPMTTEPLETPPLPFSDRWNPAVDAEREGVIAPQGGKMPPLQPMTPPPMAPVAGPPQAAPISPPVERPQVAVNPGPRPIPPRLPRDPSVDLESLILPRDRMPYPDATERDWGQRAIRSPWAALIPAGAKIAQTVGPLGSAIGAGVGEGFKELGAQRKELRSEEAINQRAQALYQSAQSELRRYQQGKYQQGYFTTKDGRPLVFDPKIGQYMHPDTGLPLGPTEEVKSRSGSSAEQRMRIYEMKKADWLKLHPGDEEGATRFAGGQKTMSGSDIAKIAAVRAQADKQSFQATPRGSAANPKQLEEYQERRLKYWQDYLRKYNTLRSPFDPEFTDGGG